MLAGRGASPSRPRRSSGGRGRWRSGSSRSSAGTSSTRTRRSSPVLEALSPLSWFTWTAGHRPLAGVTDWPSVALLAVVTVGLLASASSGSCAATSAAPPRSAGSGCRGCRPASRPVHAASSPTGRRSRSPGASGSASTPRSSSARPTPFAEMPQHRSRRSWSSSGRSIPGIDLTQPSGLLQLAFFGFASLHAGSRRRDLRRRLGER